MQFLARPWIAVLRFRQRLAIAILPAIVPALLLPVTAWLVADAYASEALRQLQMAVEGDAVPPKGAIRFALERQLSPVGEAPPILLGPLIKAAQNARGRAAFRYFDGRRSMLAAHFYRQDGRHVFIAIPEWDALAPMFPAVLLIAALIPCLGIGGWWSIARLHRTILDPAAHTARAVTVNLEREVVEIKRELNHVLEERNFLSGELRLALTNVDRAVRERTSQLEQARHAAEEASRTKSAFLAAMSHEIRTPMTGVLGMVDLLLETPLNHEQRDYLRTLRSSGDSLLEILNEILDFSKIEAGKLQLDHEEFCLASAVEEAVELFAEAAFAKGLEIGSLVDPEIPTMVRGDVGRLRQILLNLLGNAVKFTTRGEILVTAMLERLENSHVPGHVTIRFEVRDSGVGIPREETERLFAPYEQAAVAANGKYGGTGLGLAISRQLVSLMEGEIGVESELGRGSTFHFTARLEVDESALAVHKRLREVEMNCFQDLRVLIITPSPFLAGLLRDHLKRWGARAHRTGTIVQACEDCRNAEQQGRPFGLIVVDSPSVPLPIRGLPERLLMVYNPGQRDGLADDAEAGRTGLVKPFRSRNLKTAIQNALQTFPANDSPAAIGSLAGAVGVPTARSSTNARILVAEDNAINQKLITKLLERLGHSPSIVTDGYAAVEAATSGRYDLVLMDCHMPQMDGYGATRAIRDTGNPVPIVALTATHITERHKCLEAGMNDFLSKPIQPDQLRETIERWLTSSASVEPAPSTAE